MTPLPLHIIAMNCTVNEVIRMNTKPGNLTFNTDIHHTDEGLLPQNTHSFCQIWYRKSSSSAVYTELTNCI